MRRLYLRDCASGDLIEDVYVLTNKQLGATSTGKYFIKAFISDRTCQITARMWNATREVFNDLPDGGFVALRGRVENYQNNLQLIIEEIWPPKEGTFDLGDLMAQTQKDVPTMLARLKEVLNSVQNRHVAALLSPRRPRP
jgi:3'-5' exoribonuclease